MAGKPECAIETLNTFSVTYVLLYTQYETLVGFSLKRISVLRSSNSVG